MTSTTTSMLTHSLPGSFDNGLDDRIEHRMNQTRPDSSGGFTMEKDDGSQFETPRRNASKTRSLSDAPKPSPSTQPVSGDLNRYTSKDDSSISSFNPETPERLSSQSSMSLQLPTRTPGPLSSMASRGRAPLSPNLDSSHIYGSPASVLPRRSRGLDFSRACTNLHHSTLADSSPDSSPVIAGRGVSIPRRRRSHSSGSALPFSTSGQVDRTTVSSSVSSVNMLESDTSSSEEEEDELMIGDRDDMMIPNTPQPSKLGGALNPFAVGNVPSPGSDWMGSYSQAAPSLMSFQRARLGKNRSRHSSSSGSGNSAKPSPGPLSPPVAKSIENSNGGYFGYNGTIQPPRRESLSMGANDLRLSDFSDDGENRTGRGYSPVAASSSKPEGGPLGVVRRAVSRRGSLLPKTKNFARIRAALFEESAPIDSEAKRESDVIRQVRESEPATHEKSSTLDVAPSPKFSVRPGGGVDVDNSSAKSESVLPSEYSFSNQAIQNSAGPEFWNSFDGRYRTPPPPSSQRGPSVSEEDTAMDMTPSVTADISRSFDHPSSHSSSSLYTSNPPQAKKRRREDDLDPNIFKRRAVSPSMSVQSSPIMPQSPAVKDGNGGNNTWGPPKGPLGPLLPEPHGSHDSGGRMGASKRVGLQGMSEANDGFMNMSIE